MSIYIYVVFLKTTSQLAIGSHHWNLEQCPVLCLCANYIFMIFKYGGSMLRLKNQSQKNTHVFFPDKQWVHTKEQSLQTIPKKVLQNETRAVKFGVAFPPKQWFRETSMHC